MCTSCCSFKDPKQKALKETFARYQGTSGSLIPILQEAQEIYGYLSGEVMQQIARELNIPYSKVYGVVTFYAQFHLRPRGRNIIRICTGTACHVKGADRLLETVREATGLEGEGTTEDLRYTLETVACLGACGLAPAMMINEDTYGRLTPVKALNILKQYQ
ncbi:NADH dehydrogenase subunit E [Desulforamulus reducens MI-1]|uniref:NADH dehydrogenase subunit E n=1 Tax=Desulforamulus reducens (strain ATCC BAA-1160 / DSM 100696 / MI-1) TaxID=349161 RepID=A4J5M9_DESRM|nr:NADH-quinone oxidoreductase subunit NuoE [Desulforamulus reducens]ABO50382.1 NADH dehydrogenase subunit E [Desulforamulus reducens MI-1]